MTDEPPEPSTKKPPEPDNAGSLGRLMGLGAQLTVTVGIFVALGWWLDHKYGWWPWGTVGCSAFGITAAMYQFVKDALRER